MSLCAGQICVHACMCRWMDRLAGIGHAGVGHVSRWACRVECKQAGVSEGVCEGCMCGGRQVGGQGECMGGVHACVHGWDVGCGWVDGCGLETKK